MSTPFSWADTALIALSSCLPCFSNSSSIEIENNSDTFNRIPRARPDELQGLLVSAGENSDTDAERMSLHSNPGHDSGIGRRGKKRKAKKRKKITLFGIDLFGGPSQPPIHLPESDDEEGLTPRERRRDRRVLSASSSTFDSDAPVLDSSAIAHISLSGDSPHAPAQQALQESEEERRQRKERRSLEKAHRREERRARKALELRGNASDEFEGFQGSEGAVVPQSTVQPVKPSAVVKYEDEDDNDGLADFDGRQYARKRSSGIDNGGGSRSGSDSRSRTTTTTTGSRQPDRYTQPSSNTIPNPQHLGLSEPTSKKMPTTLGSPTSTSASRTSASRSSRSVGSSSTSQSSPISPTFSSSSPGPKNRSQHKSKLGGGTSIHATNPTISQPSTRPYADHGADAFDGTQGLSEADIPIPSPSVGPSFSSSVSRGGSDVKPSIQVHDNGDNGFPSRGFSTMQSSRMNRSNSLLARGGAFLATRGD